MSGILANSNSVDMSASALTSTGYITDEQITFTLDVTGTTITWELSKPTTSTARAALRGSGASVTLVPDVEGYYVVICVVDGVTYRLRFSVVNVAPVEFRGAGRWVGRTAASVPTPNHVGDKTEFLDSVTGRKKLKDSSGNVIGISTSILTRDRLGTLLTERDVVRELGYVRDNPVTGETERDPGHVDVRVYLRAAGITDPTTQDCSAALTNAETEASSNELELWIIGAITIGSDHTQSARWTIRRGASVTVQSGKTLTMAEGVDAPRTAQWLFGTGALAWTNTDPVWANWFPGAEIGAQVSACWAAIDWSAGGIGPHRIDFIPTTIQTTAMKLTRSRRQPHELPSVWCHGTIHCQVVESSDGALDGWCIDMTGSFWLELHNLTISLEQGAGGKYPTGPWVEGRDENNVTSGLVAKSSGGHLIVDPNVSGISEFGPVNIGSEGNEYRGGSIIIASANGAGVTNGRTQRVGWYLAGDNFRFRFKSADPACVLGNGDVSGATTTVADLAVVAGSPATITGTGLPTVSPGDTVTFRGRQNLINEYRWIIDSIVTPGAQWTAHKEYGDPAETEGAVSTEVLVNALAATTSIEARINNTKVWCTDVITGTDYGLDHWAWPNAAGNVYVDGFQSVTWYQGEIVAGPDPLAGHLILDCSRRRTSGEAYGYYSHPSAAGNHYNNSIMTVGRPTDLPGTAWITNYLVDFSGTLTQVDAASAAIRYGRTFSGFSGPINYAGSLAFAMLPNARVDGAKWNIHSNQVLAAHLQGGEIIGPVAALDVSSNGALASVNGTRLKTAIFDQQYGTNNEVVAYRDLTTGVAMTENLTHGADLSSTVGAKETWTLDFTGLTGATLNSKYFTAQARSTANGALVSHYFWFNSSGGGSDPTPGGTGHAIAVSDANDGATCANAARLVVAALTTIFTASNAGAVLSLANVVAGAVSAPTAGNMAATLTIATAGTDVVLAVAAGTSRFQRNLGNNGTYRLSATGATAIASNIYEILRTAGGSSVLHVLDDTSGDLLTTIPAAFTRALFKFDGTNWAFRPF